MAQAPKQPKPQPDGEKPAPVPATREVVTEDGATFDREVLPNGIIIEVRLA